MPPHKEDKMSDNANVGHENAADPAEDHKTPGGQPGDNSPEATETVTSVETPGGTKVTEAESPTSE